MRTGRHGVLARGAFAAGVLAGAAVLALVGLPAAAAGPALSARDRADIARIEAYLNALRTVRADFVQSASNGGVAEGKLYIRRPGRLRLDYAPPTKLQIFADGFWLIYVDGELEQANHIPLKSTPARILVDDDIRLSGDVTVTGVERRGQTIRVRIIETDDADAGTLVLTFGDRPLVLRQWSVIDAQGVTTRVALINAEFNVSIDNEVFRVNVPIGPPERRD